MTMRAIALVPLLFALTPRGPHGSIGDSPHVRLYSPLCVYTGHSSSGPVGVAAAGGTTRGTGGGGKRLERSFIRRKVPQKSTCVHVYAMHMPYT